MNFVLPFCKLDRDQVPRWLSWVEELGGIGRHKLFIMPAKGECADFKTSIPFEVVPDYHGIVSPWSENNAKVRCASGPNSMFRGAAEYFAFKKIGPWTFIEPDCIPLRPGWHDEWEAEYQRGGKPFMGAIVDVPDVDKHSTGNMVCPQNTAEAGYTHLMLPQRARFDGESVELAFDVAGALDVLQRHHNTHLIQHVFRGPEFETQDDLSRIDSRACLFHNNKSGNLIRLLRERNNLSGGVKNNAPTPSNRLILGEDRDGENRSNPGNTKSGIESSDSTAQKPLIHTYFRPCDDKDALAEQKRILAIWERSWREDGFEPVILTEAHARKHPKFEELYRTFESKPTISPKPYEMACWMRWVAMATLGNTALMVDYDVLPFGGFPMIARGGAFPTMLCIGVPCAVIGSNAQFEAAIKAFIICDPVTEQGQPHLSDMHAAQKLVFPLLDICREYGKPGWKEAKLVHFNHYSCNPRKRSECMEGAAAERAIPPVPTPEMAELLAEIKKLRAERDAARAEISQQKPAITTPPKLDLRDTTKRPYAKRGVRMQRKPVKEHKQRTPEEQVKINARMAKARASIKAKK